MAMITFANFFAILASFAGLLSTLFNIPQWLYVVSLTLLLFISVIPCIFSLVSFFNLRTSRWMCFKLDICSYFLGTSFDGWLAQRMVEGTAICCNNNLTEPQTILFDEYFTLSGARRFENRGSEALNYTHVFQYKCYHQLLSETPLDGFAMPSGTFSELAPSEHDLEGVMKLMKTNRVCIYFKTGEITQRIAYDGGECSVSNFIYTHSKEHFVGTFKIQERRMKQLFYIKGIESIFPKLKVADFVKVRRGVMVMHYCGDKAFYQSLHGRDIVRVTLDKCRILSYEGSFHLQWNPCPWKMFSSKNLNIDCSTIPIFQKRPFQDEAVALAPWPSSSNPCPVYI